MEIKSFIEKCEVLSIFAFKHINIPFYIKNNYIEKSLIFLEFFLLLYEITNSNFGKISKIIIDEII